MLVSALIGILERTNSPLGISVLAGGLEMATGIRTRDLVKQTGEVGTFNTVTVGDWYSRNGYDRIAGLFAGGMSVAGISVNADKSLESSAVYACVKIIAEDMGSLPFFLYRRDADRRTVNKAFDDPLYRTLHDLVNPDVSAGEFVEMLTAHAALGLDGVALIERKSQTVYLYPWMPSEWMMDTDKRGQRVYIYQPNTPQAKTFQRKDVFHLRGFTMDGKRSDPILQRARQALGLTLAAQEYAGRFFSQDASPGIILKRPMGAPALNAQAVRDVKAAWMLWHRGLQRAHEPAILQDGTEAERLDPDHGKLQLIEQRKFQVIEVCRLYRMSPHKLADLDRATFANIEELNIAHLTHTLAPWRRRWRDTVYRCLLTVDQQMADRLYAEHDVAAFLQGNFQTQSEGFRKLLEKGVYSINEVRRLMNMNPVPGGDEHFIQLNMATVQDVATGATLPADQSSAGKLLHLGEWQ